MQVAADFKCQDLILFDESDNVKSFYHIPGIICDRFDCHDGIVKPEFLSECGALPHVPVHTCGTPLSVMANMYSGSISCSIKRHWVMPT